MSRQSALIVHAHPEPTSFSTAQAHAAAAALEGRGHRVDMLDLYADGWAPVLSAQEFEPADGPFKPQAAQAAAVEDGTLDPGVREHLDRVLAADLLVLSFPLWWFSVPAVLKGWVDRVFVMGGVFGGEHGIFDEGALAGRSARLLMTTGGAEDAFVRGGEYGALDDFLYHVQRGMLEFVGYCVLPPVVTHAPVRLPAAERELALAGVHDAFGSHEPAVA